jgi:Barstar (barnase inhibitor)
MPVWEPDDALTHPIDYRLVINTFVTMFHSQSVLADTVKWLAGHGYDVRTVDASTWAAELDMHRDLAALLEFPDYYGHNLAALNDCLRDVAAGEYGVRQDAKGLVLLLRSFEVYATLDRRGAQSLLDTFATQARGAALIGNRMLCLVQSNDPRVSFEPVGATPVVWNDAEWLKSKRGV